MTTFTRLIPHRCPQNPDWNRFPVRHNDYGVDIATLPGVTRGCPFCWAHYLDLRRDRFERYAARAFVARPSEIAPVVVDAVRRLERPGFPENGICSHLGVHVSVRALGVALMPHGARLKVVMSQSLFRRPATVHRARAEAVAAALVTNVQEIYNGKDGHDGVAVVLTRGAPEPLIVGISNYRRMRSPFDLTAEDKAGFAAFRSWYEAPLA